MVKTASPYASPNVLQTGLRVSPGATDCHVHIFDPVRFPYLSSRRYTPAPATVDDLIDFHVTMGFSHVVLVQPSVYGTNNDCLIDSLQRLGPIARGIAVIGKTTSEMELDAMVDAGVCGIRLNLQVTKQDNGAAALAQLKQTIEHIKDRISLIQINCSLDVTQTLAPTIMQSTIPILFDHFGHAKTSLGVEQPGFDALETLLKAGKAYVKLSGPYQISGMAPSYADIVPIAQRLIAANPGHVVWGSDWPHTGGADRPADHNPLEIEAFRDEDDLYNLGLLATWTSDRNVQQSILVDTPARLFGFSV